VVTTTPARGDFDRAERLARAARARGADVALFLMDAAVVWGGHARAAALIDEGCEVTLCGTNSEAAGVVPAPGVHVGSQDDHARLVRVADRVVAFT
jgi:sulfur relay (sulfurtransferase) complex TusBCD TusD component (DsrE family)